MTEKIGINAGKVWDLLNENGATTAKELREKLNLSQFELHLALGWLSREDKLDFINEKATKLTVALK